MLCILLAAVCVAADQALKLWVSANIPLGGVKPLIPGVMSLTHLRNTGMAFSLLSGHTWILAVISAAVAALLIWLIFRGRFTRWEKICMALILGGAVGNLIDRLINGYVVDMFKTEFVDFAVFNLADSFIDVGALIFCVLYIVRTVREDRAKKEREDGDDEGDADGGK